jgi:pyridoxal phosphate enzyme (YggS family)
MTSAIADNLAKVRARIDAATTDAGRRIGDVVLVAVSKTFDADAVREALAVGQRVFGENRVQEAAGKFPALKAEHADLELHLIGPLQTNKVREAVALFDVIQTVDRDRLVRELAKEMTRSGRRPKLFVQVNIGDEPQKAGVAPADLPALLALCRELSLAIAGLMCIPPVDQPPAPFFDALRALAAEHGLAGLSMGMSGDYAAAVAAGATHVRVGSAIFGGRPPLATPPA